jgi:hypothetical protein
VQTQTYGQKKSSPVRFFFDQPNSRDVDEMKTEDTTELDGLLDGDDVGCDGEEVLNLSR